MIEFNLLPNVKRDFIKAKRTKRLVISVSILVAGCALAVMVLLFIGVNVVQKGHSKNLSVDIADDIKTLKDTKDLEKILTIQNQLSSLTCKKEDLGSKPCLHDKKPATTRIFDFVALLTPNDASIVQLDVDFDLSTITLAGNSKSSEINNRFVDTLKFTKYQIEGEQGEKIAFSSVVLGSFSLATGEENSAAYQITFKFDPIIFDNTKNVKLVVPKRVTTRSETEKPNALFESAPKATQGQ